MTVSTLWDKCLKSVYLTMLKLQKCHANVCRVNLSTHPVIICGHVIHVYCKCAGFTWNASGNSQSRTTATNYTHNLFAVLVYSVPHCQDEGGRKRKLEFQELKASIHQTTKTERGNKWQWGVFVFFLKDLYCLSSLENTSSGSWVHILVIFSHFFMTLHFITIFWNFSRK